MVERGRYLKVFLGMLAIWFCAWGMWSYGLPYFNDDAHYSYKLLSVDSLPETLKKNLLDGWLHTGIGYFSRPMDPVYLWFGYRLGAPLHHLIMAFFHFLAAYLFWILLIRMKTPYIISLFTASVFLVMPVMYEAVFFVANTQPLNMLIFLFTCLAFLKFRSEARRGIRLAYILALNLLLFFIALGHPFLLPAVIMIAVLEAILSLKESGRWGLAFVRAAKTGLLLAIGPAIYVICYMVFPHVNKPGFNLFRIFHVFLSVQYHCARALLSMLSLEWISCGIAAFRYNLLAPVTFVFSGAIFYLFCFHNAIKDGGKAYAPRPIIVDMLWGYLWMISGFFIYMLDLGFASNSRSYYLPSLGISIMAGSILHLFYKNTFSRRIISALAFLSIILLTFFTSAAAHNYDGKPLFWKAALNRALPGRNAP